VCREPIYPERPEMGGPSQADPDLSYGPLESRPVKELRLSAFMDIEGLQYVDIELFAHLKLHTLGGVQKETWAKLISKGTAFLKLYRTDMHHPVHLVSVLFWTAKAAMLPSDDEMRALELFTNDKLYTSMYETTRFAREGEILQPARWCGLIPAKKLEMYKSA
jgi:hypothetical protein